MLMHFDGLTGSPKRQEEEGRTDQGEEEVLGEVRSPGSPGLPSCYYMGVGGVMFP
jgi:hypothetical protein